MRRLPIYFVVGTGESMRGEPIESVKNGLQMLIASIRKDPQCFETAYISVITFGDHAVQLVPLTPIEEFAMPDFTAGGGSALGEALQLLCTCREREVVKATAEQKGDWRPLVFILTDHVPTDDPQPGIDKFRSMKWGASVCCAAGPGADKNLLEKIAPECVVELATCDQSTLSSFIHWPDDGSLREKSVLVDDNRDGELPLSPVFDAVGTSACRKDGDIESVTGISGRTYQYVWKGNPPSGAMKDVYSSPDGSYVVAFLRDASDVAYVDRMRHLVGPARHAIFDSPDGEYWKKVFCWPNDMVQDGEKVAIILPTYPRSFLFAYGSDTIDIKGSAKEGKWFTNAYHRFCTLDGREIGDWRSYFNICLLLARGVRRLHIAGFAHSDLSYRNVLVDPVEGSVHFIGLDYDLIVPSKYPPVCMGTPDFIAPEVYATMHLPKGEPNRKLPCQNTDLHALAVLIYMYLLCRHPLEGNKIWDNEDEQHDKTLAFGEKAVFIEDPTNKINRYTVDWVKNNQPKSRLPYMLPWMDLDKLPYTILGPYMKDLFDRAFIKGLHNPSLRPKAFEWEQGIIDTMDLMIPCQNPQCKQKWFVFDNSASNPRCPFCGAPYKIPLPVLNLYNRGSTTYRPTGSRVMVYNGTRLYQWHSNPKVARNEKLTPDQTKSIACFQFHQGKWYLRNERAAGMMDLQTKQPIAAGSIIELKDGTQIRLDGEDSRMIHIQMVNK